MYYNLITSGIFIATALFSSFNVNAVTTQNSVNDKAELNEKTVESPAKQTLIARLARLRGFQSDFTQRVTDDKGNELLIANGQIAVQKPNLVHWKTTTPDESLIVSDGETLWFYDPFIEEASAYRVDSSVANTPILLLTTDDKTLWQQYQVTQTNDNSFLVHANNNSSQVQTLELDFADKSHLLNSFTIFDVTGQLSKVILNNVTEPKVIDSKLFEFQLPEGVYLDDQR